MKKIHTLALVPLLSTITLTVFANTSNIKEHFSFEKNTQTSNTNQSVVKGKPWEQFYLTEDDWKKYEHIKKGFRGYWTPDLDPVTTLGVEAKTEEERRKYARIFITIEGDRIEREVAFENMVQEEFSKMYPNVPLFDPRKLYEFDRKYNPHKIKKLEQERWLNSMKRSNRLTYITSFEESCTECQTDIKTVLQNYADKNIDIYFVNSGGNDEKIRQFAVKHNIPLRKVQSNQISLNHDKNDIFKRKAHNKIPTLLKVSYSGDR